MTSYVAYCNNKLIKFYINDGGEFVQNLFRVEIDNYNFVPNRRLEFIRDKILLYIVCKLVSRRDVNSFCIKYLQYWCWDRNKSVIKVLLSCIL